MNLKPTFGILMALTTATPVLAQNVPSSGCYERIYSAAHLANNPNQGVESIRLKIENDPAEPYVGVFVAALMSTQGQARRDNVAGQVLDQGLFCPRDGSGECFVECDGGSLEITDQSSSSLTFRTGGLRIGDLDGCGGQSSLAEPGGGFTTYRLNAVAPALCEGMGY